MLFPGNVSVVTDALTRKMQLSERPQNATGSTIFLFHVSQFNDHYAGYFGPFGVFFCAHALEKYLIRYNDVTMFMLFTLEK